MSVNDQFESGRHAMWRRIFGWLFLLSALVVIVLFAICAIASWFDNRLHYAAPGMDSVFTAGLIALVPCALLGILWSALGSHR